MASNITLLCIISRHGTHKLYIQIERSSVESQWWNTDYLFSYCMHASSIWWLNVSDSKQIASFMNTAYNSLHIQWVQMHTLCVGLHVHVFIYLRVYAAHACTHTLIVHGSESVLSRQVLLISAINVWPQYLDIQEWSTDRSVVTGRVQGF